MVAFAIGMAVAPYTFSVYLRGNVGGEQIYIMTTPDAATFYRTPVTLTTQWQRVVLTTPALTAVNWFYQIGVDLRDASQTSKAAQSVYMWGAQVEQGNFPTSYIPTAGAIVTRTVDQCSIAPASMGFYTIPGGSWAAEFISLNPTSSNGRIIGLTAAGPAIMYENTSLQLAQFDGAGALPSVNLITTGAISKGATTWAANVGRACLNSGAVASSGTLTTGYASAATSGVYILNSGPASNADTMTGYIRRLRYWPRVLSDTEMQTVTT